MSTKRTPRYDDVFRKGTAWLDSLAAGDPPCLFAKEGAFPCDLSYPDTRMFCKNCARFNIALNCGVPLAWVPECHADLSEDELISAIEKARDAAL
jgi:hypothetical protein